MQRDGHELRLTTHREIKTVETGMPPDGPRQFNTTLEDDLVYATTSFETISDTRTTVFQKTNPSLKVTPENYFELKDALQTTIALGGLRGAVAKITGKKRTACRILQEAKNTTACELALYYENRSN